MNKLLMIILLVVVVIVLYLYVVPWAESLNSGTANKNPNMLINATYTLSPQAHYVGKRILKSSSGNFVVDNYSGYLVFNYTLHTEAGENKTILEITYPAIYKRSSTMLLLTNMSHNHLLIPTLGGRYLISWYNYAKRKINVSLIITQKLSHLRIGKR